MTEAISTSKFAIQKNQIIFGLFTSCISAIFPIISKVIGTPWGPDIYQFLSSHDLDQFYRLLSNVMGYFHHGFFIPFFAISEIYRLDTAGFLIALTTQMLFWFLVGATIAFFCKKIIISIGCLFFLLFPLQLCTIFTLIVLSGPDRMAP
jgi:hypothetical protein